MKATLLLALLITSSAAAQDWKEIDDFLDQEKAFQSLFYLKKVNAQRPEQRFALHNRLIEAHFINRTHRDTLTALLAKSESFARFNTNKTEKQYFEYSKSLVLSLNDQSEAIQLLLNSSKPDGRLHAFASLRMGDWLQNLRKYNESLERFDNAIQFFKKDSLRYYYKLYRSRYLKAISLKNLLVYEKAEKEYQQCLLILNAIPENLWSEQSRVFNNLGNIYNETGQYKLAKEYYEKSLRLKETFSQDSLSNAITYSNLGTFFMNYSNLREARQRFSKALDLMPKPQNASHQVRYNMLVSNYSGALREFGEFATSKKTVMKAIQLSSKFLPEDDPSVLRLFLRSIEDAISLDEIENASQWVNTLDKKFKSTKTDAPIRQEFLLTLTNYLFKTEQYDSCLSICRNLLNQASVKLKPSETFYVLVKTANCLGKLESFESAIPFYRQSYQEAQANHLKREAIEGLSFLSATYFKMGMLDSTEWFATQSLKENLVPKVDNADAFIDVDGAIACYSRLAVVSFQRYQSNRKQTNIVKAVEQIQLALAIIKAKKEALTFEGDQFEFGDFVSETFELASDIYFQAWRAGILSLERLIELGELHKAQILLSNLSRQEVDRFARVSEEVYRQEKIIRQRERDITLDLAQEIGLESSDNSDFRLEKLNALTTLNRQKQKFLDSLEKNLPDYFQLKYSQTIATANAISTVLPESTLLVEYVRGQDGYIAIGISSNKKFAVAIPNRTKIDRLVTLQRNQLRFKLDETLKTAADLYKILFKPIDSAILANKLEIKELVIIPDGQLTLVPFELLYEKTKRPRFLVEKYSIFYNYSATLYWQKRTDPKLPVGRGLVAFAPVFGKANANVDLYRDEVVNSFQLTELPETKSEAEFIARLFEQKNLGSSQVFNTTAHEETFKKLNFSNLSIIHLATHGFAGSQNAKRAGVAFSQGSSSEDDILFVDEIYDLHMPTELVTLSACETGLGKYYAGEGLVGLTRALFYAGASNVLVSMWKVQDQSTAELMKDFYSEYLGRGKSKSVALRSAKLNMIKKAKYRHPFYWSAFILLGAN